jgi:uncharacterized Rossmann fold enzyme
MVTTVSQRLEPFAASLVTIQDEVRQAFGWSLEADLESAQGLVAAAGSMAEKGTSGEGSPLTAALQNGVGRLRELLSGERPVAVLGAAVAVEDVLALPDDCILVAADGSVGVIPELPNPVREAAWENLALVVSDGDGGEALDEAMARGVPFALHAHGDNAQQWALLLERLTGRCELLLLTHQCPSLIEGMHNPGGFTDGDRAACLLASLGVNLSRLSLVGFRSDRIGRWTGATDPILKMQKLQWMDEVLTRLTTEAR